MPAPPSSFTFTPAFFAASAMRPASAIGSSRGPSGTRALRALDLDDHGLQVGHLLERAVASNPPDAAAFARAPAERDVRLPVVRRLVDVDPADLQCLRHTQRPREVARVDRSEQAVRRI